MSRVDEIRERWMKQPVMGGTMPRIQADVGYLLDRLALAEEALEMADAAMAVFEDYASDLNVIGVYHEAREKTK